MSGSSLKSSLAEIWRKVQLFAETRNLVSPHQRVVDELRAQGWKYEEQAFTAPLCHPGAAAVVIHEIYTPEGDRVKPGTPERRRFDEARAVAARKVFAPTTPSPGPA